MPLNHVYDPSSPDIVEMSPRTRYLETLPLVAGLRPFDVFCACNIGERAVIESLTAEETKKGLPGFFIPNAVLNAPYMASDTLIQEVLDGVHGHVTPKQRVSLEEIVQLRRADAEKAAVPTTNALVVA